MPFNS